MNNSKENNIIVFLFDEKRIENDDNNNKITIITLGTDHESINQVTLPIKEKSEAEITSCILISRVENIKEDIIIFSTKFSIYVQNVVTYNLLFDVHELGYEINYFYYNEERKSLFVVMNKIYFIELNLKYKTIPSNNIISLLKMIKNTNDKKKNNVLEISHYDYYAEQNQNEVTFSCSYIQQVLKFDLFSQFNHQILSVKSNDKYIGIMLGNMKSVYVLSYETMKVVCHIKAEYGIIKYWSFEQDFLFISPEDNKIYIIDTNIFEIIFILEGHKNYINDLICFQNKTHIDCFDSKNFNFKQVTYNKILMDNSNKNRLNERGEKYKKKRHFISINKYMVLSIGSDGMMIKWSFSYNTCNKNIDVSNNTNNVRQIKLISISIYKIIYPQIVIPLKNDTPFLSFCYNSFNHKIYTLSQRDIYKSVIEYKSYNLSNINNLNS